MCLRVVQYMDNDKNVCETLVYSLLKEIFIDDKAFDPMSC